VDALWTSLPEALMFILSRWLPSLLPPSRWPMERVISPPPPHASHDFTTPRPSSPPPRPPPDCPVPSDYSFSPFTTIPGGGKLHPPGVISPMSELSFIFDVTPLLSLGCLSQACFPLPCAALDCPVLEWSIPQQTHHGPLWRFSLMISRPNGPFSFHRISQGRLNASLPSTYTV